MVISGTRMGDIPAAWRSTAVVSVHKVPEGISVLKWVPM